MKKASTEQKIKQRLREYLKRIENRRILDKEKRLPKTWGLRCQPEGEIPDLEFDKLPEAKGDLLI